MNHSRAEVLAFRAKTGTMRWHKPVLSESSFRTILSVVGAFILLLLLAIFFSLVIASFPAIRNFGIRFLFSTTWDPVRSEFGAFPFLVGTLATSFLALVISVVFSIPVSIFLGEYSAQGATPAFIKSMVELLAGVPSVIYGFCGLFLLAPLVRVLEMNLGVAPYGVGIFTASLVLSIMIIPYSA
jgi:phosphate transport system permease protein